MARPLRIEYPGAIYHITSRGDRREPIFEDDEDRLALLDVIAQALRRFDAEMVAYCLMGNHYHFVLGTRQANLSRLMRHINGVYTQYCSFKKKPGIFVEVKSVLVSAWRGRNLGVYPAAWLGCDWHTENCGV